MSLQTIKDVNNSDYSDNDGYPPPFDYNEIGDYIHQWIYPPVQYNVNSENQSESITSPTPMLRELDEDTRCVDKVSEVPCRCTYLPDTCIRSTGRKQSLREFEDSSISFTQDVDFSVNPFESVDTQHTPVLGELDEDTGCRDKVNNIRRCVALSDSCIRSRGRELFRCEDEDPSIPFTQNTNFNRSMIASLTHESLKNASRILNLSKDEIQFVNKARDRENRKINTGNSRSKEKKEIIKQKEEIEKMEDQKIQLKEEKSELEWEIKEYKRLSTNLRSF